MGTPEYEILIDAETEWEDFMGIQLIQENRQSIFYVKVNIIQLLRDRIWATYAAGSKLKSKDEFESVI